MKIKTPTAHLHRNRRGGKALTFWEKIAGWLATGTLAALLAEKAAIAAMVIG